ncbi:PhaM family polyhydroxyalkanoate granule multifunctional regulatory protein [Ideonella sp. DXS29W]|uniref:PhaM family polyhydroxyalkanoate granule multifunctional regulatory protein n=1 Tax=Ideonella lacteola TaxID=2984193 RepID=A0ABU9C120_9BURK
MADAAGFTKMVPGFDFLQGLVKNAGAALPNMGQWIAPTLNPEELEKRIEELRTVQFWLEQNARMLGATIQALEVQRMTLSTLKTMNVQMGELRDSIKLKVPEVEPEADSDADDTPAAKPAGKKAAAKRGAKAGAATVATPMGTVDPMQWWGALTKQFTSLAASTLKDSATDAAKNLAGAMVKQSFDAAGETIKRAVELGTQVPVKVASKVAAKAVEGGVKAAGRAAPAKKAPARKRA